jgi:sorbitol/mannitol transport system substrate-binding protein
MNDLPSSFDIDDILPAVRGGLSHNGVLYAAPFYGESSFTMYRVDLFAENGLTMPDKPTWGEIYKFAKALHNPPEVNGICLRGKPGWGENAAFIGTVANAFGARWVDDQWNPQLTGPAWTHAFSFYVDLVQNYGPKGAPNNGFNENLKLLTKANVPCGLMPPLLLVL